MSPEALKEYLERSTVSPYKEVLAYEYLYSLDGMTLKKLAEMTVKSDALPTQALENKLGFLPPEGMEDVQEYIDAKVGTFHVAIKGTPSWPSGIADSARPSPLVYYCGDLSLLNSRRVSVVGSRKASPEGIARAARLGREFAEADVTVVSGLAAGVDTAAMTAALREGDGYEPGRVIGVIGTPIDEVYPRENAALQRRIAKDHLLISQVPFYRYKIQPFKSKRFYFPERNELMAAVSLATVIVEASDTSGTLAQARACLHQHRPLFILRSCYENEAIVWPKKWAEKEGVFVLDSIDQVIDAISF